MQAQWVFPILGMPIALMPAMRGPIRGWTAPIAIVFSAVMVACSGGPTASHDGSVGGDAGAVEAGVSDGGSPLD
jgi:hypothetical protein